MSKTDDIDNIENIDNEEVYGDNVNFINVFLCYYKHLFNKKNNTHMFTDVDYDKPGSTNRCMELLYDEMYKYSQNEEHEENCLNC